MTWRIFHDSFRLFVDISQNNTVDLPYFSFELTKINIIIACLLYRHYLQ